MPTDENPDDIDGYDGPKLSLADLQDRMAAAEETYADERVGPVVVVDGYAVAVKVRDGCLYIRDGVHPHRRERLISRSEKHRIMGVIVLGAGVITTEAMLWCHETAVPMIVARTLDGPTMMGAPALYDFPRLRRAQALAAGTPKGLEIMRHITLRRLADMADVARSLAPPIGDVIERVRLNAMTADNTVSLRGIEGACAKRYWGAWRNVALTFTGPRVPPQWRAPFPGRGSPINKEDRVVARNASHPVNALLNYAFKLAETQAVLMMMAAGLDPAMGIGHYDPHPTTTKRQSGALDLIETARGTCEHYVLNLIKSRTCTKRDFVERSNGVVAVGPPLSHQMVADLVPPLQQLLADEAVKIVRML